MAFATVVGLASAGTVVIQAILLSSVISDVVLHRQAAGQVVGQLVGLGAAFAVRSLLSWTGEVAANRTSAAVTSKLRRALLHNALALGPVWLVSQHTGELSTTATRGVRALDIYFGRYLPQALQAATVPLVLLVWVGFVDWPSFLILLGLLASIPWTMIYFGRRANRETSRQWRRLSSLAGRFLELIQGLPTLRAFGQTARGRQEVVAATEGLRRSTLSTLRVAFLSSLVLDMLAGLGVGLVAMALGLRLLSGALPLSTALAVLLVSPEVFLPVRRAAAEFHASTEGKAAAERILDVIDTRTSDTADHLSQRDSGTRLPSPDPSWAVIRFEHATIRYPGQGAPAVNRFDLELNPGDHVALQGPSGSGKSTVLAALLGFISLDAGTLTVAGTRLDAVERGSWHRHVSWVPQRPYVMSGTLADNVRLGAPEVGDTRLQEVLEAVGLTDLVRRLPHGTATAIGEGGFGLSAGERQRLALGRAMLRDVPLVLLDEPYSYFDPEDLEELAPTLQSWLQTKTALIAAHQQLAGIEVDRAVTLTLPSRSTGPEFAYGNRGVPN